MYLSKIRKVEFKMEIRKLKNGWQFVNNWRSNRSGFVHETTLFNDSGYKVGEYKCQYYNRTWECYEYQTVMKNCIYNLIEEKQKEFISRCKEAKGIKRLVKAEKEIILQHFEQLKEIKEYRKMYKELDNRA